MPTTRYVRKTGNNSNAGTSPSLAKLTIGNALGVSASGDTLIVGGGTYRETINASTKNNITIIGDVDGSQTGDPGEVILTAFKNAGGDNDFPSTATLLVLGRDPTIKKMTLMSGGDPTSYQGARALVFTQGTGNTGALIQDCCIWGYEDSYPIEIKAPNFVAINVLIERCRLISGAELVVLTGTWSGQSGGDIDSNIIIRNCLLWAFTNAGGHMMNFGGAAGSPKMGGMKIYNCTAIISEGCFFQVLGGSTTYPCAFYNCFIRGAWPFNFDATIVANYTFDSDTVGALIEDYNIVLDSQGSANDAYRYHNVTKGVHTKTDASVCGAFHIGHEWKVGAQPRIPFTPIAGSPLLGWGGQSVGITDDITGSARPAGGGSPLNAVGAFERGNTFAKETTTTRSGSTAISAVGPAYQDFDVPVINGKTTIISVWVNYDGSYTGTAPQMQIINGTEAGVSGQTATAGGSAGGGFTQIILGAFTPSANGIVTVRVLSNDTSGVSKVVFDDFNVV